MGKHSYLAIWQHLCVSYDTAWLLHQKIMHALKQAIANIHANLKPRGTYVFDIFNLNFLLGNDNIIHLTMDVQTKFDDITAREI